MFRKVVAALLGAAALVPAVQAQEMDRQEEGSARAREWRMEQRAARGGNAPAPLSRPAEAPRAEAFRPEPQRQPDQPRSEARGDRGPRGDAAPRAERPAPIQRDWNGGDRDRTFNGRPPQADWRRPDPGRTPPIVDDRRRDDDARRAQDRRRGDDRRWNDDRHTGWNQRNDNRWQGRNDWGQRSGWGQRNDWNARGWNGRTDWNRRWRDDSRYDWGRYRQQNRGAFRLPRYYAPYDWQYGYRRFSIGVTLSSLLWDQDYWIDDPWSYRLPPADGPYRWVRYYNDALLVDLRSGYVVDAVYDIFW